MDFRCWWSCFPRRRSRCWMNGSTWIINLKMVVFRQTNSSLHWFWGEVFQSMNYHERQIPGKEVRSKHFSNLDNYAEQTLPLLARRPLSVSCSQRGRRNKPPLLGRPFHCFIALEETRLVFFVAISSWHDVLSKSRLRFQVVSSFPKQFTLGVLNATLDLAALVLVGVVGFLGSEVSCLPLSPVVSLHVGGGCWLVWPPSWALKWSCLPLSPVVSLDVGGGCWLVWPHLEQKHSEIKITGFTLNLLSVNCLGSTLV